MSTMKIPLLLYSVGLAQVENPQGETGKESEVVGTMRDDDDGNGDGTARRGAARRGPAETRLGEKKPGPAQNE